MTVQSGLSFHPDLNHNTRKHDRAAQEFQNMLFQCRSRESMVTQSYLALLRMAKYYGYHQIVMMCESEVVPYLPNVDFE